MRATILNSCRLLTAEPGFTGSYRTGTGHISLDEMRALFGAPVGTGDEGAPDEFRKVTAVWYLRTPRGVAELRDYWWNGPRELSIASAGRKPALWAAAWLRAHGVEAHLGLPRAASRGELGVAAAS